jgi:hypothetical protein
VSSKTVFLLLLLALTIIISMPAGAERTTDNGDDPAIRPAGPSTEVYPDSEPLGTDDTMMLPTTDDCDRE